jgi:hypothetical protein
MPEIKLLVVVWVILGALLLAAWLVAGVRFYSRFRGKRLVVCPENKETAAVEVDALRGAMRAVKRPVELRLNQCSRWPERQDCGQDCLSQVQADPENCLVWNIVAKWYEGQECAYCHKPFGHLEWHDHRPALMDAARKTVQWHEVAAECLPDVLATHLPVCWDCHIAETFRREHPELVTDRNRRAS